MILPLWKGCFLKLLPQQSNKLVFRSINEDCVGGPKVYGEVIGAVLNVVLHGRLNRAMPSRISDFGIVLDSDGQNY